MEDGRDSVENVGQEPEDRSLNLSELDDANHSSDDEQDKAQKSTDLDGRSTAEPPSTTSEVLTHLSDEESGSIALDDSLAEEDAVLKNNLEMMSEDEDAVGPHHASQDLQLSSDSSSSSSDLNSTSKSETEGPPHSSDVISQINSCLDSLTVSSPTDVRVENESRRTDCGDSEDCVTLNKDHVESNDVHLRLSSDSDQEKEATKKMSVMCYPDELNQEAKVSSPLPSEEVALTSEPIQEGTIPLDANHDEEQFAVQELPQQPCVPETSQSTAGSENTMVCDSELMVGKPPNELVVSDPVQNCLLVVSQPSLREDTSESENVMDSMSVKFSSNSIDVETKGEQCEDVLEGNNVSEDLDGSKESNTVETSGNIITIKDKCDEGLTDDYSDDQDEESNEEDTAANNGVSGSFSKLNGGLSESMDCDDTNFSGTCQGALSVSSSDVCTKRVVTSNALNAAWKKAFANTAKRYEESSPDVSWKSPLLETSITGSSETSSNESSAQEEEEEDEEEEEHENGGDDVEPAHVDDSSTHLLEAPFDSSTISESLNPVCEVNDHVSQAISDVSDQDQRLQSSNFQASIVDRNSLVSHSSVSGPGKRLFEPSQSLAGMHVNIANPIPEYPQYLGVQPTVKFKCVRCGVKGFTSMMELKTHQLSCSKNSSPAPQAHQVSTSPSASTNFRITRKVYLCSACGTYYENWNLFLHMREVHKRHICLFCLGMFSQAEKLSLHLISKHKVTEGHYSSPEDFKCSYKGSWFLMCCSCEKMFTEDNFTNHLCRGDFVVCAVCGGEGIHLPSCQLSSSSRNQGFIQPKRLQPSSVPEASKSSQTLTEKDHHHTQDMPQERNDIKVNNRASKVTKKAVGSNKSKQILKVKIPIKPPAYQDSSVKFVQSLSKGSVGSLPSSNLTCPESSLQPGSNSSSNLDKTINAVALGLTDEAREWEERMAAERRRIEEAKQIYTDSDVDSVGVEEEAGLLQSSSSGEEEEEEKQKDVNNASVSHEESLVAQEGASVNDPQTENSVENAVNESQLPLLSLEPCLDQSLLPEETQTISAELKESGDADDTDSERLSLVVDENQPAIVNEAKLDSMLSSEEIPLPVPICDDESTPIVEAMQEDTVRTPDCGNKEGQFQENPTQEESLMEQELDDALAETALVEADAEMEPVAELCAEPRTETDETLTETPPTDVMDADDTNLEVPDNTEQVGMEMVAGSTSNILEEVNEVRLIEGYTLAGNDVPETELALDKPLHIMKTQEVLKECVRTLCWTCVYCSHAKKIAVNGKQLALHVLSEHRITPIDGTRSEVPAGERLITKLKEALDPLHSMHFNTDSYDSTDVANSLPYDRSYECFQCHFYTRLHKELYIHNRKMHQKTILLCIMCKSNFYSYSELLCHLCPGIYIPQCNVSFRCCMCNVDKLPSAFRLMVHLRKRHHACDVCLEVTDDQQKLSNHVWKHKLHHLCYRCGIAYRNKPDITKHLFWKHGTESVLCKKCLQKKWPHVYHFCVPPATFVCEECSATFSRAVSLRVHKRLHSEDLRYSCVECEEKFISKKLLAKHILRHEAPVPQAPHVLPEEEKENAIPEPEISVSPIPKSTEDKNKKPPEEKIDSGITSPIEKKHSKKKKHKRDEPVEEEKRKKSVDVFDLPPLNLSSDSDSSDNEGKNEVSQSMPLLPAPEEPPPQSSPIVASEDKMEVEEPAPIIDGIWDKFQNFQASLEMREALDDPEQFMRRTIMMDHDYCLPPGKPPGTVAASTLVGDNQPSQAAAPLEGQESLNLDASATPKSSPIKKKKTPKKRERENSGRVSSSSSSDSSSDSDSSSCSCGSNCSCSSSSSSSSGSSSSSSDSDDSSSSEGRRKAAARKQRHKEREEVVDGNEPQPAIPQPVVEEPHIDVLEAEPTVHESDLDTTETDTDEDFYDDNPQKLANELLQEKRNLMLLAAVAPINNGGLSPTQSPSSQPSIVVPPEPASVKRKGKKRRKRPVANSRQAKANQLQSMVPSQEVFVPLEQQYPSFSEQPGLQEANVSGSTQQSASSLYYVPQTASSVSNPQVITSPFPHASHSGASKARKAPLSKFHDYSTQSVGSGSETEGRTKRRRMRNRFYGFGSDEDEESNQQTNSKVRKSNTSYPQELTPALTMPPLTIKRNQIQPILDPVYKSPTPSAQWSTNLLPSVKSNSDNDSDIRQVDASSSSDTDSDDDAMHIAESPPPPPPPPLQYETPRTGENKDNLYCYCQCPYDEVSEMIACDGVDCRIEWFHFECVGIMVPPKGQWYCPDCRRRMSGGQDYVLN